MWAPAALLGLLAAAAAAPVPRPVIAMFTQDRPGSEIEVLAASYVKWVEQEGARVVPLRRADGAERIQAIVSQADGLLFPGGEGEVPDSARLAWKLALGANARGVPMPVFGTCLGFEWLMELGSADASILMRGLDSENISLPLLLTPEAAGSRMLGGAASAPLRAALAGRALTMNNHKRGVSPAAFERHPALSRLFRVLSTSRDRGGVEFISTVEARALPVFATQWHPEKAQFEWGWQGGYPYEAIEHSGEAILASQHLARIFVAHARRAAIEAGKLGREAPRDDWWPELVWHYPVGLTNAPAFVQSYLVGPVNRSAAGGGPGPQPETSDGAPAKRR